MYGTVGHLIVKPGGLDNLKREIALLEQRQGVITMSIVSKDDNADAYYWTILWTDKSAHDANSGRPEFPADYQRLVDTLAEAPNWHSGEIVYTMGIEKNLQS